MRVVPDLNHLLAAICGLFGSRKRLISGKINNLQPLLHNTPAGGGWVCGDCRGRRQSHDEAEGMGSPAGQLSPTPDFRRLMRYVAVQFNSLLLAGRDGSLQKISG